MAPREEIFSAATKFLAPLHFHQSLWIPETAKHPRLRVTFATTSNFARADNEDESSALPTMLFAGPMFGTRYMAIEMDRLSREHGVRGIFIDRPGFGGSTPVPLSQRVAVWIEAVPLVLARLNVKHVALFSHSAGTIYSLNTLGQLREILDPARPYVAFIAPYIHNDHSSATLTTILSALPNGAFSGWDGISRFINLRLAPMSGWSSGAFNSLSSLLKRSTEFDTETDAALRYGVNNALAKEIEELVGQYIFTEGALGANDEARLCLKKGGKDLWGVTENFKEFVQILAASITSQHSPGVEDAKLHVRLFFAESDVMSGKKGEEYFDHIWRQNEACRQAFDVKSISVPGTNHETILGDHRVGALSRVFDEVRRLHEQSML